MNCFCGIQAYLLTEDTVALSLFHKKIKQLITILELSPSKFEICGLSGHFLRNN